MEKRNKRILWLINHTTLRETEIPLLIDLGYEVYTPKIFPEDEANKSASIDYNYDKTLSIPPEYIIQLNQQNFYSKPILSAVREIINSYFGTAIIAFFQKCLILLLTIFRVIFFCEHLGYQITFHTAS